MTLRLDVFAQSGLLTKLRVKKASRWGCDVNTKADQKQYRKLRRPLYPALARLHSSLPENTRAQLASIASQAKAYSSRSETAAPTANTKGLSPRGRAEAEEELRGEQRGSLSGDRRS